MAANKEKKLNNIELSAFCGQMALFLKAGISASEGISAMKEDDCSKAELSVLDAISEELVNCMSFAEAIENTNLFPKYAVAMIKLGESTGNLDDTMEALQHYYEVEDQTEKTIKSAIIFPSLMAIMMLVVIVVLLVFVLPVFEQVYAQLGTEMSGVSKVLLNIGNGIGDWGLIVLIDIAAIILICFVITRFEPGKEFFSRLGYKLNFMKKTRYFRAVSRITSGLSMGLSSGLDINESFKMASGLNEEPAISDKLMECQKAIEQGDDAQKALTDTGIVTGVYARMLSVANKTGQAPQVLMQISDMNAEAANDRMNSILAAIEPVIVIVLSILVGIILLSVMLPLLGIVSGI